jgi:hypothetical protein
MKNNTIVLPKGLRLHWRDGIYLIVNFLAPDTRTRAQLEANPSWLGQPDAIDIKRNKLFRKHRAAIEELHQAGKMALVWPDGTPAPGLSTEVCIARKDISLYLKQQGFEVRTARKKSTIKMPSAKSLGLPRTPRKDELTNEDLVRIATRLWTLKVKEERGRHACSDLAVELGVSRQYVYALRKRKAVRECIERLNRPTPEQTSSAFNPRALASASINLSKRRFVKS